MLIKLKKWLYFFVAGYFRFWARFVLERWQPRIVVITGSNGKTTTLHLVESQLGDKAIYSHHANSAFGIPFHILGLERKTLKKSEWLSLVLKAPFQTARKLPEEKLYIVEADCDRPREGRFLAELLRPSVVLWVSSGRSHSMNYDRMVGKGSFINVEEAIAYEFGHFIKHAQDLVILNADINHMAAQVSRASAPVKELHRSEILDSYEIKGNGTTVLKTKKGNVYTLPALLPEEAFYSVAMTHMLTKYLKEPFDAKFKNYQQPPSRSTILEAKNGAKLFDSTYNSDFFSMKAALNLFGHYPAKHKWAVISDMVEQGEGEKLEHQRIAELLAEQKFDRIILMGPRVMRYTKPALKKLVSDKTTIVAFEKPKKVLDYLEQELTGKEAVFFKGARFLEGVIKNLLKNPEDEAKLCRREAIWQTRREKWGVG